MSARDVRARAFLLLALAAAGALVTVAAPEDASAQGRRRRRRRPRRPRANEPPAPAGEPDDGPEDAAPEGEPANPYAAQTPAATTPAAPEPVPDATGPTPPPPDGATPRPPAIDVSVAGRLAHRDFFYNEDIYNDLRGYTLPAAPALSIAAEWYPGAHFSAGPLAWFGLTGAFEYAFIFNSRDAAGNRYRTRSLGYSAGLRVRVPIRGDSDVGVAFAYGRQSFAIEDPNRAVDPEVPGVDYQYLRFGASGRWALSSRFALTAGAAYLYLLGSGEITSPLYFPRATGGGVELNAGASVALAAGFEIRAGFTLRRYFFAMRSEPGDGRVAGGAVDQYLLFDLALAWRR